MGRKKNVKLEDVAKAMGVSVVTVSNALKGKKGVSDELREKIVKTAEELGYRTEKRERHKKESYLIGVIIAERYVKEFPSFYMEVYKNITQEAIKRGSLTVLEVATPEKEKCEREFSAFQECAVSGVMLIGELKREYIELVRAAYADVPVVCVDYYDVYEDMDYIVTDGFGGMEQMTRLMLKSGIKDLAFVGTVRATKSIMDRYMGYCKALDMAGVGEAKNNIIEDRDENGENFNSELILPEVLPQGFVCNCDRTAYAVIKKLQDRGVRVPEDVSVVGFDDYPTESGMDGVLSTYRNDRKILAYLSVRAMLRRIEGKGKAEGVRIVEGNVVYGDTMRFKGEKKI